MKSGKTDLSVFDPNALSRMEKLGGTELVIKMVDLFVTHGGERMEAARTGWKARDLEALERAAHSLKSSAGNVGAVELQRVADALEGVAADGKSETIPVLLQRLEDAFSQAKASLKKAIRSFK